jgi:hypothetical protein
MNDHPIGSTHRPTSPHRVFRPDLLEKPSTAGTTGKRTGNRRRWPCSHLRRTSGRAIASTAALRHVMRRSSRLAESGGFPPHPELPVRHGPVVGRRAALCRETPQCRRPSRIVREAASLKLRRALGDIQPTGVQSPRRFAYRPDPGAPAISVMEPFPPGSPGKPPLSAAGGATPDWPLERVPGHRPAASPARHRWDPHRNARTRRPVWRPGSEWTRGMLARRH